MVSPISAASHKDFCGESCDKSSLSITINTLFTIIRNPSPHNKQGNREVRLHFIQIVLKSAPPHSRAIQD
jgi:hypothetical protein